MMNAIYNQRSDNPLKRVNIDASIIEGKQLGHIQYAELVLTGLPFNFLQKGQDPADCNEDETFISVKQFVANTIF